MSSLRVMTTTDRNILLEGVTHTGGVVDLQFGVHRVHLVPAHPLSPFSELHHVFSKSYALH